MLIGFVMLKHVERKDILLPLHPERVRYRRGKLAPILTAEATVTECPGCPPFLPRLGLTLALSERFA